MARIGLAGRLCKRGEEMIQHISKWGLEWFSKNRLDGPTRHLIFKNYMPKIFQTRKEAREFATQEYGYIKTRKDLRSEPHGWRLPKPVRITGLIYFQTNPNRGKDEK